MTARIRAALTEDVARDVRIQERFAVFLPDGSAPIDPPVAPEGTTPRAAAVLLIVYEKNGAPHLLLTRRPTHLNQHGGQISFPGGSRETEDTSLTATALRETYEELGLASSSLEVVGALGRVYIPPTNFDVAPFVAVHEGEPLLRPDPNEVAEVLEVPVELFLDDHNIRSEPWELRGRRCLVPHFVYRADSGTTHAIWGATARMLAMFVAALRASES